MQVSGTGEGYPRRTGERLVLVRRMDEVDLTRILRLRSVVSWSADPEAFELLRGMRDARWAVAEDGEGGIVGMVGAVPLGPVGVLCHLAVHDSYRRAGLGARLARWAVDYLRSRGAGLVRLDSTTEAEGLYHAMGFEPILRRAVYRLEEVASGPKAASGRYRISTLTMGDLPEVYGLDRWSFGADRSAIVLAAIRLHPGRGLVARDGSGAIKGYLMRGVSGGETKLGPFLAEGEGAAAALLGAALEATREVGGGPVEVISTSPTGSPERALLEEFGFTARPDRLRMELGSVPRIRGLAQYGTTPYLAT